MSLLSRIVEKVNSFTSKNIVEPFKRNVIEPVKQYRQERRNIKATGHKDFTGKNVGGVYDLPPMGNQLSGIQIASDDWLAIAESYIYSNADKLGHSQDEIESWVQNLADTLQKIHDSGAVWDTGEINKRTGNPIYVSPLEAVQKYNVTLEEIWAEFRSYIGSNLDQIPYHGRV